MSVGEKITKLIEMKTPNLDNLINDLKAYDRNDMLSDNGRNQLNEYEAIKQALSLGGVSQAKRAVCPDCGNPNLTWYGYGDDKTYFCFECKKEVTN